MQLPPFIAEAKAIPLHWRYAAVDKFEVLSLCSDDTTEEFMRQLRLFEEQLDWIVPPQLRLKTSLPITYILCDESMQKRLDQDIPVETFLDGNGRPKAASAPPPPKQSFITFPHMGLQDADSVTVFSIVDHRFFNNSQLVYLPEAMESVLRGRTPPLPAWFINGFLNLYGSMSFTPVRPSAIGANSGPYDGPVRVKIEPFVWISNKLSSVQRSRYDSLIKKDPGTLYAQTPLLRMEELLIAPQPPVGPSEAVDLYNRRWLCQAELFVRYALDDSTRSPLDESNDVWRSNQVWRESFWRFLTRSSMEPVTEAMFQDCFGISSSQMRDNLVRYFYKALFNVANPGTNAPEPPSIHLREATPSEVSRIKGDWERLETAFVKKAYPGLSAAYLEHARHTLWLAYEAGDRDPRLLAAMGLWECDAGDDTAARPLLMAAIQAQVVRPKAYFELARIFYEGDLSKPAGARGKLSAAQTDSVLALLASARRQSPPMAQASELFADALYHSDHAPSPADLAELEAETILFPKSSLLVAQAAVLEAQAGLFKEANQIVDRGLENATDETSKGRLVQLRASLIHPK